MGLLSKGEYDQALRLLEKKIEPDWESDCGRLAEGLESMIRWAKKGIHATSMAPGWREMDDDGDTVLEMLNDAIERGEAILKETDHQHNTPTT